MCMCMRLPNPPRVCHVGLLDLNAFAQTFGLLLDFPRDQAYFRALVDCSRNGKSLEWYSLRHDMSADSFFHHFSKHSLEELTGLCNRFFAMSFERLVQSGWRCNKAVVAVDFNDVEHWGVADSFTIKTIGKKVKGVSKVYRYATVAVVAKNFKFTLACLPFHPGDRVEEVVRSLLKIAMSMVDVDLVLMDRGFYNSDVFNMLEDLGLYYLVHARKSEKTDVLYRQARMDGSWTRTYTINKHTLRRKEIALIFRDDLRYDYMVMVCNRKADVSEIALLFEVYRERWNIENSYKDSNSFKTRTTSKNPAYRHLLYTLSHLLVNLLTMLKTLNNTMLRKDEMQELLKIVLTNTKGTIKLSRNLLVKT